MQNNFYHYRLVPVYICITSYRSNKYKNNNKNIYLKNKNTLQLYRYTVDNVCVLAIVMVLV